MTIHLERTLRRASCNQPGLTGRKTGPGSKDPMQPLFGFAPGGVYRDRLPLPAARCALTAPFHPYPLNEFKGRFAFCGTNPWGRPRRALPGAVFFWSPDFPLPLPVKGNNSGHPAIWQSQCGSSHAPRQGFATIYAGFFVLKHRRCHQQAPGGNGAGTPQPQSSFPRNKNRPPAAHNHKRPMPAETP